MTARDFCYWLQGFFEISGGGGELSQVQAGMIRKHLALVFKHEIDPSMGDEKHQAELNAIHGPKTDTPKAEEPKTVVHHHHHSAPPLIRC